jgi:hypothetical protein
MHALRELREEPESGPLRAMTNNAFYSGIESLNSQRPQLFPITARYPESHPLE